MPTKGNSRNRVLSEQIFEQLEQRVVDRVYPPGAHLIEDEIARDLGVSRTPVREAFRALQRAGWVQIHPHSGAYVRHATFDEVRDLFELRQWLEERAARAAAERITEPQIRTLRKILEKGHNAVEKGSSSRVLANLNSAFHEGLAIAAGNGLVAETLKGITKHVHWHFTAIAETRGSESWAEHDAILDAIVEGRGEAAGALMIAHSQKTQDAFLSHLRSDRVSLDHGG